MGTTPEPDLFEQVGAHLYSEVFGPGTDLHIDFSPQEVVEALRFAHVSGFDVPRGRLVKEYSIEPASVPDLISQVAAKDEYSFFAVGPGEERASAGQALRGRVAAFLKSLPAKYPELCPADYLASHEAGLFAVVLLMEGNGQGLPVYRSVRVEPDTPELLDGKPVRASRPTGQNQEWAVSMIVRRGLSLEGAQTFRTDYERAEKIGEPQADELIRAAVFQAPQTPDSTPTEPDLT